MKIAVLGSYSTQILVNELKKENNKNKYYESEYDQIDQEIINQKSGLYKFNPEIIIIHETLISFKNRFYHYKGKLNDFNDHSIERLKMLCSILEKSIQNIKIIYTSYDLNCDLVYGNYYSKVPTSFDSQLFLFNYRLINFCSKKENFFLLDINKLALNHPNYRDERMLINFDIHFSIPFTKILAKNLKNLINTINGDFIKCIILDLDNTIWGGSIGEDGLENIKIGDLGIGKAFSNLQIWLKSLKNRGIILCVCSKNNESIAKEPFIKHSEMILRLDDIAVFVANWKNKVGNIKSIKNILNIDFSSMIFLDDSPFERNLIKENISDIKVPDLPKDPSKYLSFLQNQNLFEITNYSNLDEERTKLYQITEKRQKLKTASFNISDYLKALKMNALIDNINNENISRVHQLIQRSNQFNSRTIRYEKSEIINFLNDDEYLTYVISLDDNYGKNGIIACAILKTIDQKTIFLDTLVMSCRVFNRGVEFFLIDFLKKELIKSNFKFLMLEWIPSDRNILIEKFYRKLGYVNFKNKIETKELEYIPINKFYIKLKKGVRIEKRKNINPT